MHLPFFALRQSRADLCHYVNSLILNCAIFFILSVTVITLGYWTVVTLGLSLYPIFSLVSISVVLLFLFFSLRSFSAPSLPFLRHKKEKNRKKS